MRVLLLFLFFTQITFSQSNTRFERSFNLTDLQPINLLVSASSYNFANLWTQTKNSHILGVIGNDHQRIRIKIISVKAIAGKSNEYKVTGKSSVKGTICDFSGEIILNRISELQEMHYGVDDYYKDKEIISQGILIAHYEFKENKHQKHSGVFKGKLYTKWYVNSENKVVYDNIESNADSYMNNAFIGVWISYTTGKEKICNWGDYRVPNSNQDFDIGAGEFSPNKKYLNKGWSNYNKAWVTGEKQAREIETAKWWK